MSKLESDMIAIWASDQANAIATRAMITCTSCKAATDPLALFPGDICLACYELTPAANAPLTEQGLADLTRIWSGK